MRRTRSLDGRLALWMFAVAGISSGVGAGLGVWLESAWSGLLGGVLVAAPLTVFATRRFLSPIYAVLQALADGVSAMRDADFSLNLANDRDDELGQLLTLYNEVSSTLRDERQSIYQRELLLDAVIQASPLALLLTTDRGDVIYDNAAARRWFFAGQRMAGTNLTEVLDLLPLPIADAVRAERQGLVQTDHAGDLEVFHVSHRWFHLNARRHRLVLMERLTHEIHRKEVETWKKVIRLISHELRNSLGPIASLARSGRRLSELEDPTRLVTVLSTIEERAEHLEEFISGYARFAKLPLPRPEPVPWESFIAKLEETEKFTWAGDAPAGSGYFDAGQIEQALINLIRNAREAGSEDRDIEVEVSTEPGQVFIVRDRGSGMTPAVLQSALLPFYSTKRSGTGLGLPLCREIAEAHGGRLQITQRDGGGLEVVLALPPGPTPGPRVET
ncbi:MAG: ATP-binding protein [Thermoanaerobaculia bacterium]|nr:ATP-binding protein [Thermoanaerobaculia bacterium]